MEPKSTKTNTIQGTIKESLSVNIDPNTNLDVPDPMPGSVQTGINNDK